MRQVGIGKIGSSQREIHRTSDTIIEIRYKRLKVGAGDLGVRTEEVAESNAETYQRLEVLFRKGALDLDT